MIVVTGAAGFIGANLLKGLNAIGITDILAVDHLKNGHQYHHLARYQIADYEDQGDFLTHINQNFYSENIKMIFHQGACSHTTEWNGHYMMQNNFSYSKQLLHYCLRKKIPFIYASSAAVYGRDANFRDSDQALHMPSNVYGYSKWLFDQYVLRTIQPGDSPVVGLRYFNVYGPHEEHKGSMASVAYHFMNQIKQTGEACLFEGSHGYPDGGQLRDFIYVDDVVQVNLWFMKNPEISGIFNCGTGQARPFQDIASILIQLMQTGKIRYIPFPDSLKDSYQPYTQADLSKLRQAGYTQQFKDLETGLQHYYQWRKIVESF
jgi:ADP-L-glycero-D-manno-heptose 6-epimerase